MATKTAEKTQEFTLQEVFALWKKESKSGNPYFTGKSVEGISLRGFFVTNKKNPKEPDLRVYTVDEHGNLSEKPITSLWCNVSKKTNHKYLTGALGGQRVIAFIRNNDNDKQPYVKCYYSEDAKGSKVPKESETPKEVAKDSETPKASKTKAPF